MKEPLSKLHEATCSEFSDEHLTFYMQVFSDQSRGLHTVGQLRLFYPRARVVVRSDGAPLAVHPWSEVGAEIYEEERLFPIQHGGRVVQRMLEIYADRPTSYLMKIDPDTVFHRRFHYLPTQDGLFGSVQGGRKTRSIQGGFIGVTRTTALAIRESKLLLDPKLRTPTSLHGPYMALLEKRALRCGLSSFDCLLGWAASTLGHPIFDFSEVRSNWKTPPENKDGRYAVTHPDSSRHSRRQGSSKSLAEKGGR